MKKITCLSFASVALLLSTIAYSQSTPNPLYRHLPPKADHVYEINFNQLNTKGNLSAILSSIPMGNDPTSRLVLGMLKDPGTAGIDLGQNIVVAQTSAGGTGADTLNFTYIVVQMTDSSKFRTNALNAIHGLHFHRLAGKGTSTTLVDKMGLAWNDRVVVVVAGSRDPMTRTGNQAPGSIHRSIAEIATDRSLTALAGFTGSTWTTDQRFLTGFATDADIHFWSTGMNMGKLISKFASKLMSKNPAMQAMPNNFPKFPTSPANTPILSTFNFADGRIVFHMTTFNQPDNAATLKRFQDRPFNKELIARLPDGRLLGWMAIHMNPAAYKDVMDKFHTRQMLDSMLAKKGLSIDDFTAAFAGDILIAAIAPDSVSTMDTAKKKINFYFVASINDPSKLTQLFSKLGANATAGSGPDTSKADPFKNVANKMVVRDNLLVISNSREQAQAYFNHTDRRPTDNIGDDDIQRLVIDLKAVSSFIGNSMAANPKAMIFARILEKLDKITFTNGAMDGNNSEATFQIITAEPGTNSLATLMSILH
jgi:hypothetical protein